MPLILGLLALALGMSLAVIWWSAAFAAALQVLCVFALILTGLIWCIVGYSELKAAREFASSAANDELARSDASAANDNDAAAEL